jgi:hypothetical protein
LFPSTHPSAPLFHNTSPSTSPLDRRSTPNCQPRPTFTPTCANPGCSAPAPRICKGCIEWGVTPMHFCTHACLIAAIPAHNDYHRKAVRVSPWHSSRRVYNPRRFRGPILPPPRRHHFHQPQHNHPSPRLAPQRHPSHPRLPLPPAASPPVHPRPSSRNLLHQRTTPSPQPSNQQSHFRSTNIDRHLAYRPPARRRPRNHRPAHHRRAHSRPSHLHPTHRRPSNRRRCQTNLRLTQCRTMYHHSTYRCPTPRLPTNSRSSRHNRPTNCDSSHCLPSRCRPTHPLPT